MTVNPIYTSDKRAVYMHLKFIARILFSLFFILQSSFVSFAHSGKPRYHVIIDTDGAVDDLRALTTLLACNDVRVLGIIGSQGTLSADSTCSKVGQLLARFHHEGIPVGKGRNTDHPLPFWSAYAGSVSWGDEAFRQDKGLPDALQLLNQITKDYSQKITLIALGALTNYSDWLKEYPEKQDGIDRLIWYGNRDLDSEFNYQADPDAYQNLLSLNINLQVVTNNRKGLVWDQEMIRRLDNSN